MPYGELKHSGSTIREAPAREASRTWVRARERLIDLSAPEDVKIRLDEAWRVGNGLRDIPVANWTRANFRGCFRRLAMTIFSFDN